MAKKGNMGGVDSKKDFRELCKQYSFPALVEILAMATSKEHPQQFPAAKFICEHAWGRASESVKLLGADGGIATLKVIVETMTKDDGSE